MSRLILLIVWKYLLMKDCHSQAVLNSWSDMVYSTRHNNVPRVTSDLKVRLQTEFTGKRRQDLADVRAVTGEECTLQQSLRGAKYCQA